MEASASSSHIVCTAHSSSVIGFLRHFSFSIVVYLPQKTLLHHLSQCRSFLETAVFHKLVHPESLAKERVHHEQAAPVWVPYSIITGPSSKPAAVLFPFSMGSQVLPRSIKQLKNILQQHLNLQGILQDTQLVKKILLLK